VKPSEALKVLALVEATWPNRPLPDETKQVWAKGIVEYEFDDAFSAVTWLGKLAKFPVSLEEIISGTIEERNERLQRNAKALPPLAKTYEGEFISFSEWYHTVATAELKAKADRYLPRTIRQMLERESLDV
jgi:hypothetical protein